MSILSIKVSPTVRGVKVEQTGRSVKVTPNKTSVKVSSSITRPSGLRNGLELDGSDFSGGNGTSGRSYTHTAAFPTNAKVYVGSANGLTRVSSDNWSISTTTIADDTITIDVDIWNGDKVIIDL